MVFFIVINLINYLKDMDEIVVLALGFFLTGGSGLSLALAFVRLYYDLRYGKALEEQIMEEKEKKRQKEQEEKEMRQKDN